LLEGEKYVVTVTDVGLWQVTDRLSRQWFLVKW